MRGRAHSIVGNPKCEALQQDRPSSRGSATLGRHPGRSGAYASYSFMPRPPIDDYRLKAGRILLRLKVAGAAEAA
jgi:hypothetical protein